MPKYDDDQCEECGAARVSGSRLCAGCLLRFHNVAISRGLSMARDNKELERKVIKLTELCERLLDHITNSSVYTGELEQAVYSTWLKNWKEGQDEKGRVHDNKQKQERGETRYVCELWRKRKFQGDV